MKIHLNKNIFLNFLINFISIFLIEIIFKLVNKFSLLDWSILRILLSSAIISFVISSIEYFINKKIIKYVNLSLILIFTIYSIAQTGFNKYIGVYMSLGTSSQFGAVTDYIKEFILSFKWYYYLITIPFIISLIYYIFFDKKVRNKFKISNEKNNYKLLDKRNFIKNIIFNLIMLTIIIGIYISTFFIPFMQNRLQTVSNKDLFINPSVPSISIKEFGVVTYGGLDIKNYFFPTEVVNKYDLENVVKNQENRTRKFDDSKWEELIENETNETLNTLNKYFINNEISNINDYTGVFKDKNLIVIMLESTNDIIINEEDYPNFYKMYNEGWRWINNYSPRNSCSTGNNEMSGMIGLYSIYNTCTANKYKNNKYFQSIFNMFESDDYYTFSAHNYLEHYYDRRVIHTNMGSEIYYGVEDLGIEYSSLYKNWSSDEDFMESVLNILDGIDEEKNFMTWLTTVSSHQPYSYSSTEGDKYLNLYEEMDIKMDLKRYKSKLKILDNALGILLDGLKEKGILDDTVIVMFGDHYPYGLSTDTINSVLDYDTNEDYEAERVPFVIYNTELESKSFRKYTSYINILPTLLNLFDVDYDPRLYVGNDLLSKEYESLVVFADGSWKNEVAYFNASTSEIEYFTDKEYTIDQLKEINNKIDMKMEMSSLAIKNNYFEYLNNKLSEEKLETEK